MEEEKNGVEDLYIENNYFCIMKNLVIPFKKIGEKNWKENLISLLEKFEIDVEPLENKNLIHEVEKKFNCKFPKEMVDYYTYFGGIIDNPDFMYNLKPLQDFTSLSINNWDFATEQIKIEDRKNFIVFAESPSSDPICIKIGTNDIYLFSHDPRRYAKIFNNFSGYVISEIIALQELLGDVDFENEIDKQEFLNELLKGNDIDYEFRYMKLF